MSIKEESEALVPAAHHRVKLNVFEGPLDLLLFLIRKNEIDIYDIPIESVTQQYLDYLFTLEKFDLELTGEFFVMAATLMVIKSRMLIPKNERPQEEEKIEEDEEDPRWELVQQLLDYKKLKEQARELEGMMEHTQGLVPRIVLDDTKDGSTRPLKTSDKMELWGSFNKVLQRLAERLVSGEINEDTVTVAEQMTYLIDTLDKKPKFYFSSILPERASINMLVASFLALLELSRLDKISLEQTEDFGDILCSRKHVTPLAI